jgi:hypothetical protein
MPRADDHVEPIGDIAGIARFQRVGQKLDLGLDRTEVAGRIESDRPRCHGQSSRSATRASAVPMSRRRVLVRANPKVGHEGGPLLGHGQTFTGA